MKKQNGENDMKLKDMKQMDDQIQIIQDRIHAIIRRMKKSEPNMSRLREVVAKMICHNRRIRDQIEIVKPFYQGDITAPVPTHEQRIENLLNTKLNGANRYLVEFGEACSAYLPGELPNDVLDSLRDSTISLIVNVLQPLYATVALNVSVTVVSDMINFLKTSDPRLSRKEYLRKLDKHIERLIRRFCQNSDAFYDRTNDLIAARRAARNTTKRKSEEREARKGSKLRGTRTRAMAKQMNEFENFLVTNPISEIGTGKTINARARQFWALNAKRLSAASIKDGEGRGYPSAKSLASAYRTSRS